ncbi:MAG: FAD-dependent oxidoreductase [Firmicutes bacterium]|nr:FAD-dependent oxidoreductase [Bacillota bacterium]
MNTILFSESIPVKDSYDLIVAGGGMSGVAAALAGARNGLRVLLIERNTSLGGLATIGLVNFWVPLCNGRGKQVIRGMAEELLRLSVRHGFDTLPEAWKDGEPEKPTDERYVTWYSSGIFSLEMLALLKEAGVDVLYLAWISAPVMDGDHCRGVIVDSGSGRLFYECRMLIDATGDAALLEQAGVPTVPGFNYHTYYGEGISLEGCRRALESGNLFDAYEHYFGGVSDLYGRGHPEGKPRYCGSDLETVNLYLQENQLLLLEKEKNRPRLSRTIHMLPGVPQLRETRRIAGDAVLHDGDMYHHSDESIGAICDFDNCDSLYEVPYGALVHSQFDNLMTCGRSAAGEGWGWDLLRVIPPAVLTGQAAGTAAALAIREGCPIAKVPIGTLQQMLADADVLIHFPDSWLP